MQALQQQRAAQRGNGARSRSLALPFVGRCARLALPTSALPQQQHQAASRQIGRGNALVVQASADPKPVVDKKAGRMTYKPKSYGDLVSDVVGTIKEAMKEGENRLEVEFPPVPVKIDGYKGSSDLFIDSNIQLAITGAKQLAQDLKKRVHVVLPDAGEYERAYKLFKPTLDLLEGVTLGQLNEKYPNTFNLATLFGTSAPASLAAAEKADIFIVINATCVELTNVQRYWEEIVKGKTLVMWNLELDSLRGDLGIVGYPSKDMHYKFLAHFKPVFYLRPRDYSKSVPVAPFIVNYSGALFREYPGPWQVMLRQDSGEYACIAEDPARFNLGDVKEEMQAAMGLNTEEEGSALQTLRRGIKNSTWWEDDAKMAESAKWMT